MSTVTHTDHSLSEDVTATLSSTGRLGITVRYFDGEDHYIELDPAEAEALRAVLSA